jgi:hypothetical protein
MPVRGLNGRRLKSAFKGNSTSRVPGIVQARKGNHSRQSDGFERMGGTKVLVELLGARQPGGSELLGISFRKVLSPAIVSKRIQFS